MSERQAPKPRKIQLVSPTGNLYTGVVTDGEKAGKFTCPNGNVYVGSFSGKQLTGFGTMTFSNGSVKTGQWLNGTLVAEINQVIDRCGKPPTTRASKIDVPDFGPDFEVFTLQQQYCGPRAIVSALTPCHHIITSNCLYL